MKRFIAKVNTYLLEKYPIVWNTRLLWMLAISLLIHICFYIVGFLTITNVEVLHKRNVIDLFFNNGAVFFGILISILQLVIWLIYMFKNNAFKSFYPTTRFNLFTQFIIYFVIILSATTFYYSFTAGIKTYVGLNYEDEKMDREIKIANDAAVFLSHQLSDYSMLNLRYPDPLDSLYCVTESYLIDEDKSYFTFLEKEYQFYSLKTKVYTLGETFVDSLYQDYVDVTRTDSTRIYYFKDTVVDVSEKIISSAPSYYNYSGTFYATSESEFTDVPNYNDYYDYQYYDYRANRSDGSRASNKQNYELLQRNDSEEIKTRLKNFLDVSDSYNIKRNMDADTWFKMVYKPDNFEVSSLILRRAKDEDNERIIADFNIEEVYTPDSELTEYEKFVAKITTDSYIESAKLYNVFRNVQQIKDKNVLAGTLQVYIWLTFFLAIFIFTFRITSLRTVLFAIIASGVLITVVSLIAALYTYASNYGTDLDFFISYLSLAIGSIILSIPLFFLKYLKKIVTGVFLSISLWGFVPYLLLIFGIITMHQSEACENMAMMYETYEYDCFLLIDYLGVEVTSTLLILAGLIFIFLFSGIIKKWKALPEN